MIDILLEDANADATHARRTSSAYRALSDYALGRREADVEVHFSSGIYYGFDTKNFGGAAIFGRDRLIILIGKRQGGMSATYARLSGRVCEHWPHGILMQSAREATFASAISSIATVEFRQVFQHEMTHCFDDVATNGKVLGTHKYGDEPEAEKYYNNPWEFNAYFHMIVSGWAGFVEDCREQDNAYVRDLADLYGITGNFKSDVASAIAGQKRGKIFLQALIEPRRKALLRRLYRMHEQIGASLAQK